MSAVRRKSAAVRAPSSLRYETISAGESSGSTSATSSAAAATTSRRKAEQKALLVAAAQTHHSLPPAMFSSPALQSLIYATNNDRYPGAPGTLLYRAKLEAARALAASKREAQREAERRDEMKRLGILTVGGNRKRGSGNGANGHTETGSNGRSSRFNTPPGAERARRSAAASTVASAAAANGNINGLPNGTAASNGNGSSSRRAPANGARHNLGNAIDHNSLPVPGGSGASQLPHNQSSSSQTSPSSPLLSSSGRLRRPANGSRGASPMPLTGPPGPRGTRSPVVANMELDEAERTATAAGAETNVVDPVVVPA